MSFRNWLIVRWQEHVEELLLWEHCTPKYGSADYFRKYRWWLRREYRHFINSEQ